MNFIRRILTHRICDYRWGADCWICFHLLDLINVWKRKGVNWKIKKVPKGHPSMLGNRKWFHWWTPIWHEERGPYITMGIGRLRFYRGY